MTSPPRSVSPSKQKASSNTAIPSLASERLRALAALSGSLTDSLNPHDAASLVEQQALGALEAHSAVVVTLGPFPSQANDPSIPDKLYLVHAIGVDSQVLGALRELPLDQPSPFAQVAESGESLFLESKETLRGGGDWATEMIRAGAQSASIVPVWANGELRGVLGLSWNTPRKFDTDERAFVTTLGVMCAQAILRAHLRAAELDARDAAEQANRAKADFLAMISHELRTPMNAVIGYNELLARGIDGPITPLQSEHLDRMRESSTHLLGLIEELLGYARIEAGRDEVHCEVVALPDLIHRTVEIIRPIADKKGLRIGYEHPDGLADMFTDVRKLRQILVNLLANAVKFTAAGGVTLFARMDSENDVTSVLFEITDTGPGISEEAQQHLFDAFWQNDPNSEPGSGGTGLGLPIARRLARLLGGEVTLQNSSRAQGSTFRLTLPGSYAA